MICPRYQPFSGSIFIKSLKYHSYMYVLRKPLFIQPQLFTFFKANLFLLCICNRNISNLCPVHFIFRFSSFLATKLRKSAVTFRQRQHSWFFCFSSFSPKYKKRKNVMNRTIMCCHYFNVVFLKENTMILFQLVKFM